MCARLRCHSLVVLAVVWIAGVVARAPRAEGSSIPSARERELSPAPPRLRLSVGSRVGTTLLDPALADFRWDVRGAATWGLETTAGRGRWAAGVRLWRTHTTQAVGIPGEERAPRVRLTSLAAVGRVTLLRWWGTQTAVTAHVGRLHLGYDPDHLELTPFGGGGPLDVSYDPIDEWIAGAGLRIAREIAGGLALGLHAERSTFALTTLHRVGAGIEEQRDRFGNWAFGLDVSWSIDVP
jgi:hypothetical protein